MTEAERDAYLLGVGRAIAYIEHTTALTQSLVPETAAVIGEWSAAVVTALRMAAAEIKPAYCTRCGIPHTDKCRRQEHT